LVEKCNVHWLEVYFDFYSQSLFKFNYQLKTGYWQVSSIQ